MGLELKVPLFLSLLLYGFIVSSNFLEHAGITAFFDPLEDVAEIVFTLVLLFFVHNWRKQKSFEIICNQEIWLRSVLASMADGVITTDREGRILLMNQAMENLTGRSREEALGKHVDTFFTFMDKENGGPINYLPFNVVIKGRDERIFPNRIQLVARDGKQIPVADNTAPIRGPENETLGFVGVFRDMTEYDALTEQLAHSQKMEAIGQLSGGIAHDMNNMLGGIMGAADVIKSRMKKQGNAEHDKLLSIILGAAENARDLTANLLAFSRKNKLFSTPISIREIIEKTQALALRTIDKRISIETVYRTGECRIVGEPSQLQNAFLNLVINGCDAMPDGGTISIELASIHLDEGFCRDSDFDISPGPYAAVTVKDTGSGIRPEHKSRIFEPFFTTKVEGKGTGLGLAAVYQTTIRHHGAISLASTPNKGTAFTIYLPGTETVSRDKKIEAPEIGYHDNTILLIEDEEMLRASIRMMLEDMGVSVLTAESGEKGVLLYKQHQGDIDLVILDMIMPGMTGLETFSILRAIHENIRVIFTSGMEQHGTIPESAAGFVRKPFKRSELFAVIDRAFKPGR